MRLLAYLAPWQHAGSVPSGRTWELGSPEVNNPARRQDPTFVTRLAKIAIY
jgi:hypothetical protein